MVTGSGRDAARRPIAARLRYIDLMHYPEDFEGLLFNTKSEFAAAAPKVQTAYCMHRFESEVNNGGFHQFFFNSSGEYVQETRRALAAIGAVATRDLFERAVAIGFPKGYPADPRQHQECLSDTDDIVDLLYPLDLEFYKYAEPLEDLVNEYLGVKH